MRMTTMWGAALLVLGLAAGPAAADSTPSASPSGDAAAPTSAGTSFRTATEIEQGRTATASASTGDYLYWSFAADALERPTVKATVKLPASHAAQTWQVDVYDGLRRRQACQYGAQTRTAAQGAAEVEVECVLRTVRAWSEPWADDPLPGTYYVRLTTVRLQTADLGRPVDATVRVESEDVGGSAAVDGWLAEPLVPGVAVASQGDGKDGDDSARTAVLSGIEPDGGWSSGWWSDRWVWTGVGAVLAALAGIGGYVLTRGTGRPGRVPPGRDKPLRIVFDEPSGGLTACRGGPFSSSRTCGGHPSGRSRLAQGLGEGALAGHLDPALAHGVGTRTSPRATAVQVAVSSTSRASGSAGAGPSPYTGPPSAPTCRWNSPSSSRTSTSPWPSRARSRGRVNQWARTASVGRRSPNSGCPHAPRAWRTGSSSRPRGVRS